MKYGKLLKTMDYLKAWSIAIDKKSEAWNKALRCESKARLTAMVAKKEALYTIIRDESDARIATMCDYRRLISIENCALRIAMCRLSSALNLATMQESNARVKAVTVEREATCAAKDAETKVRFPTFSNAKLEKRLGTLRAAIEAELESSRAAIKAKLEISLAAIDTKLRASYSAIETELRASRASIEILKTRRIARDSAGVIN